MLPELEERLHMMIILVADILRKDNRNDMVTNGYRFVAIFHILGAKETEGKFHAVLSFLYLFLQTLAVNIPGS